VKQARAMELGGYNDFVHTGPGTLAGRYLRMFWQPVYVADQLPSGWAKPIKIMSEDFTLYRGETGKPHLVAQRCAHRGTQLSLGWVEEDCIRCLYHGWKYDASGQCVEQPGEGRNSFADKVRIASYPIQEYLGLIFAYLGEGEPPPLPRYPDFEEEGVLLARRRTRPCNYFSDVENSVDVLHVAWAHRDAHVQHSLDYETVSAHESEWGLTASARLRDGKLRVNQFGMPTILHFKPTSESRAPGRNTADTILWRVPITDELHANFAVSLVRIKNEEAEHFRERRRARMSRPHISAEAMAERVLRGDVRIADLGDRDDILDFEIVNVQDDVTQVGQGVIPERDREWLGCSDVGVVLLRQIFQRELRALAEGRPIKRWTRPLELCPTSGL
jgi:5,5'-dehydrodivanillate O-demethylase